MVTATSAEFSRRAPRRTETGSCPGLWPPVLWLRFLGGKGVSGLSENTAASPPESRLCAGHPAPKRKLRLGAARATQCRPTSGTAPGRDRGTGCTWLGSRAGPTAPSPVASPRLRHPLVCVLVFTFTRFRGAAAWGCLMLQRQALEARPGGSASAGRALGHRQPSRRPRSAPGEAARTPPGAGEGPAGPRAPASPPGLGARSGPLRGPAGCSACDCA